MYTSTIAGQLVRFILHRLRQYAALTEMLTTQVLQQYIISKMWFTVRQVNLGPPQLDVNVNQMKALQRSFGSGRNTFNPKRRLITLTSHQS